MYEDALLERVAAVTICSDFFQKTITYHLIDQGIQKFTEDWRRLGLVNSLKLQRIDQFARDRGRQGCIG
jgi:hypothetical protein